MLHEIYPNVNIYEIKMISDLMYGKLIIQLIEVTFAF